MSCLLRLLHWLLTALLLPAGMAWAQLPSSDELAAALEASGPQARQNGLAWRTGLLWVEALRQRSPLVAAHQRGVCHIGFSAYTPGQDYRWLFPAMGPAQRAVWLAGVVQHELAHCAEQAAASADGHAVTASVWQQEVLADMAFALHVDQSGNDNTALVALLATLRSRQAAVDPDHDTATALLCYLRQRASFQPQGDWLARLRAWRTRCSAPQDGPPGSTPDDTVEAWVAAARDNPPAPLQPVSALR
jgi:hypothetical protein